MYKLGIVVTLCVTAGWSFAVTKPVAKEKTDKKVSHVAMMRSTTPRKPTAESRGVPSRQTSATHTKYSLPSGPTPERYKEIQQALSDKGYYKGEVNGKWGPESTDALRQFQSDQNLQSDGKLNSLSLIALGLGPKRAMTAQAGKTNQPEPPPGEHP